MARNRRNNQAVEEEMEEDVRSPSASGEQDGGMMAMLRVLMEEQRKSEERREEARLEREAEMNRRQLEQQAALEQRQYDQQLALIRLQAEIGKEASKVHRENQNSDRKKERALLSVPALREGEDLEDFLVMIEGRMEAAEIGKEEWVSSISSKLTGRLASTWREITLVTADYDTARTRFLEGSGYTPMTAADKFFGFKVEQCKGLAAGELYQKGQQLVRRMLAPGILAPELEYSLLRGWVGTVIPKRARAAIDARVVTKASELIAALQDFLALEEEHGVGQTAVFKGRSVEGFKERGAPITCYTCGKVGHRAADCWQGRGGASAPKVVVTGGVAHKIVCYTCGEEGHKSPQCPKGKGEKEMSKGAKPKQVKRVWHSQPKCVQLMGVVNGQATPILLDSGAAISVVPESLVTPERLAGCTVAVKPFGAREPMLLPIANVPFKIVNLEWEERVAVAPGQEGVEEEVLYSLDLHSKRGLDLVLLVNKVESTEVLRVTTRAQSEDGRQKQERDAREIAKECPEAKTVDSIVARQEIGSEPEATVPSISVCEDRDNPNRKDVVGGVLGRQEEDVRENLGFELDSYEEREEEVFQLRKGKREEPELVVPPVNIGQGDRAALVAETVTDPTLAKWRALADKGEKGFSWEKDLLYQAVSTHVMEVVQLMVLPKGFRAMVLKIAHDRMNHMGARRVTALLRQRFSWPGMGQDVINYCRSCPTCQQCSKAPARKVPMLERVVMSEPFESMAFDIVGPLPKGRGGCRFLLTAVCMASRWPEAVPMKTITAKAVSVAMIEIFARTGIPLQLISDQGAQFVGAVVTQLCKCLYIDKIQTTPYHPEGNRVVERMHGTLGAMLTKAASQGLDWVGQVPFALFALRAAPNRDSQFSPFELIYGRQVRTPLDILHQGWAQLDFEELDTDEWAEWLVGRLECWHDVMRERGVCASKKRKEYFDRKTLDRRLEVGDLVLCRVPGIAHKLAEAWHGPYKVLEKLNKVDYRVEVGKGRKKVLHINNLKKFQVREEEVMRLSVVAEDFSDDVDIGVRLGGICKDFDVKQVEILQKEYPDVFSDIPAWENGSVHSENCHWGCPPYFLWPI